jgi:hypothetical protein
MRRTLILIVAVALAGGLVAGLAGPASAQTGDLDAFCQYRAEAGNTEGKKATLVIMNKMVDVAPEGAVEPITALRDAYQKKGEKLFNGEQGFVLLGALDSWIYDNCPGTQVPVSATDYEFDGVPDTLAAGTAMFELTNDAPKEDHEMGIVKLTDAAEGKDVTDILALPEKKQGKYLDFSSSAFMYAPSGQSGFTPIDLEPGTYAYACFLPVGGKKNGAPHFTQGMYGTFTVE